jgi:hypothetical protein
VSTEEAVASIRAAIETARKLRAEATPGPWQDRFIYRAFRAAREDKGLMVGTPPESDWRDGAFCAHARNSDPWEALALAVGAVEFLLASASPNTREHPTMTAAWASAQITLREIAEGLAAHVEKGTK